MAGVVSGNPVKFIAGSGVTTTNPAVVPGQVVFDTSTGALYIDTTLGRCPVIDPNILNRTYVQDTEPEGVPNGSVWVDTSGTSIVMAEDVSF